MRDAIAAPAPAAELSQDEIRPAPLPLRNDTILGVCEAIGQDMGFHPNWLRLAFAGGFYWNPMVMIGLYLALGTVVAVTRWLIPALPAAPLAAAARDTPLAAPANAAEQEPEEEKLPIAA